MSINLSIPYRNVHSFIRTYERRWGAGATRIYVFNFDFDYNYVNRTYWLYGITIYIFIYIYVYVYMFSFILCVYRRIYMYIITSTIAAGTTSNSLYWFPISSNNPSFTRLHSGRFRCVHIMETEGEGETETAAGTGMTTHHPFTVFKHRHGWWGSWGKCDVWQFSRILLFIKEVYVSHNRQE